MDGFEAGVYLLLLTHEHCQKGRGLPADEDVLRRLIRLEKEDWDRVRAKVLECFTAESGRLWNKRCEQELKKALAAKKSVILRGRKGAERKAELKAEREAELLAQLKAEHNPQLEPSLSTTSTSTSLSLENKNYRLLPSSPSVRARGAVDFSREKWKIREDAVTAAYLALRFSPTDYGERMQVLIVRNALDCFDRRKKLDNPPGMLKWRIERGREQLVKSGRKLHDEAVLIVKAWRKSGDLK